MAKLNNIKNKRFGKLVVLCLSNKKGKHGERYWLCKCDCGVEKEICTNSLLSGRSKSCGSHKRRSKKIIELKGKTFGLWTVLEESGRTKNQQVRWLCKCLCGIERIVNSLDLTSGKSRSCGCSRKHRYGKNSPGWRGGVTKINKLVRGCILKNTTWVQDVFARDNYICQRCNKKGGRLQAHHFFELSNIIMTNQIKTVEDIYKCDILFDLSNGITLCEDCHKWVHTKKNKYNEYINCVAQ